MGKVTEKQIWPDKVGKGYFSILAHKNIRREYSLELPRRLGSLEWSHVN